MPANPASAVDFPRVRVIKHRSGVLNLAGGAGVVEGAAVVVVVEVDVNAVATGEAAEIMGALAVAFASSFVSSIMACWRISV